MATPTQRFYQYIDSLLALVRAAMALRRGCPQKFAPAKEHTLHILANGPSLKKVDATNLQGDKLAVNNYAISSEFTRVRPRLYLLLAPEYWMTEVSERHQKQNRALITSLLEKTDWPLTLYVPRKSGIYFEQILQENSYIQIRYFFDVPVEGLPTLTHWLFNHKLGMPRAHNVLIPSLMVGIWHDYQCLRLYGVDHSWLPLLYVDEHNNALLEQKHFYDEGKTKARPMLKKGKQTAGGRKVHEILEKWVISFKAYHLIADYAKTRGVQIINCTPGSFIDAFPRDTEPDL